MSDFQQFTLIVYALGVILSAVIAVTLGQSWKAIVCAPVWPVFVFYRFWRWLLGSEAGGGK